MCEQIMENSIHQRHNLKPTSRDNGSLLIVKKARSRSNTLSSQIRPVSLNRFISVLFKDASPRTFIEYSWDASFGAIFCEHYNIVQSHGDPDFPSRSDCG